MSGESGTGNVAGGNTLDDHPLFPVSRVPTEEEVEFAGLGDTRTG